MEQKISALFAWSEKGEQTARDIALRYEKAGMEILLHEALVEEDMLISLGKSKEASHVLYFLDAERLLLISLADEMGGFTAEVLVSELQLPK